MVKQEEYEGKEIYLCEACGYGYKEQELAKKCEDHCNKFNACSLEITKHAVKK